MQGAFLQGYRAVMVFLALVSLAVWALVSLLLRAPVPAPLAEEGAHGG